MKPLLCTHGLQEGLRSQIPGFSVQPQHPASRGLGDNTICSEMTLAEGFSILDTGEDLAVQAINLSTLKHGFIAEAFVWG